MRLLVTGCGRSGTKYASDVFRAMGLDMGHEVPGKDGTVDWHRVDGVGSYDAILHQVRHPLRTIESLCRGIKGDSWDFICRVESRIGRTEPSLVRSMKYWLFWNQRAEALANHTYRVEAMADELAVIAGIFGMTPTGRQKAAVRGVPTNVHTLKPPDAKKLAYGDLEAADAELTEDIRAKAKEYGYKR